jgi:hypothetical protein
MKRRRTQVIAELGGVLGLCTGDGGLVLTVMELLGRDMDSVPISYGNMRMRFWNIHLVKLVRYCERFKEGGEGFLLGYVNV